MTKKKKIQQASNLEEVLPNVSSLNFRCLFCKRSNIQDLLQAGKLYRLKRNSDDENRIQVSPAQLAFGGNPVDAMNVQMDLESDLGKTNPREMDCSPQLSETAFVDFNAESKPTDASSQPTNSVPSCSSQSISTSVDSNKILDSAVPMSSNPNLGSSSNETEVNAGIGLTRPDDSPGFELDQSSTDHTMLSQAMATKSIECNALDSDNLDFEQDCIMSPVCSDSIQQHNDPQIEIHRSTSLAQLVTNPANPGPGEQVSSLLSTWDISQEITPIAQSLHPSEGLKNLFSSNSEPSESVQHNLLQVGGDVLPELTPSDLFAESTYEELTQSDIFSELNRSGSVTPSDLATTFYCSEQISMGDTAPNILHSGSFQQENLESNPVPPLFDDIFTDSNIKATGGDGGSDKSKDASQNQSTIISQSESNKSNFNNDPSINSPSENVNPTTLMVTKGTLTEDVQSNTTGSESMQEIHSSDHGTVSQSDLNQGSFKNDLLNTLPSENVCQSTSLNMFAAINEDFMSEVLELEQNKSMSDLQIIELNKDSSKNNSSSTLPNKIAGQSTSLAGIALIDEDVLSEMVGYELKPRASITDFPINEEGSKNNSSTTLPRETVGQASSLTMISVVDEDISEMVGLEQNTSMSYSKMIELKEDSFENNSSNGLPIETVCQATSLPMTPEINKDFETDRNNPLQSDSSSTTEFDDDSFKNDSSAPQLSEAICQTILSDIISKVVEDDPYVTVRNEPVQIPVASLTDSAIVPQRELIESNMRKDPSTSKPIQTTVTMIKLLQTSKSGPISYSTFTAIPSKNNKDSLKNVKNEIMDSNELDDIVVHYFCLLFCSTIIQRGQDHEGIFGFLPEDILDQHQSAMDQECEYCLAGGATVPCSFKGCPIKYHYPCGVEKGAIYLFYGKYLSRCEQHWDPCYGRGPKLKGCDPIADRTCMCCLDEVVFAEESNEHEANPNACTRRYRLSAICCGRHFHTDCLQRMAVSYGKAHFQCPSCKDKTNFLQFALRSGIYIPFKDAEWELNQYSQFYKFEDMSDSHRVCSAPICLSTEGRRENAFYTPFEIYPCHLCGSEGVHTKCGNLLESNPVYECKTCQEGVKVILKKDEKICKTFGITGSFVKVERIKCPAKTVKVVEVDGQLKLVKITRAKPQSVMGKRGRPPGKRLSVGTTPVQKVGRPPKATPEIEAPTKGSPLSTSNLEKPTKKMLGRPPKATPEIEAPTKKMLGRPPKATPEIEAPTKKKAGRPPKATSELETPSKRKAGRPPKAKPKLITLKRKIGGQTKQTTEVDEMETESSGAKASKIPNPATSFSMRSSKSGFTKINLRTKSVLQDSRCSTDDKIHKIAYVDLSRSRINFPSSLSESLESATAISSQVNPSSASKHKSKGPQSSGHKCQNKYCDESFPDLHSFVNHSAKHLDHNAKEKQSVKTSESKSGSFDEQNKLGGKNKRKRDENEETKIESTPKRIAVMRPTSVKLSTPKTSRSIPKAIQAASKASPSTSKASPSTSKASPSTPKASQLTPKASDSCNIITTRGKATPKKDPPILQPLSINLVRMDKKNLTKVGDNKKARKPGAKNAETRLEEPVFVDVRKIAAEKSRFKGPAMNNNPPRRGRKGRKKNAKK